MNDIVGNSLGPSRNRNNGNSGATSSAADFGSDFGGGGVFGGADIFGGVDLFGGADLTTERALTNQLTTAEALAQDSTTGERLLDDSSDGPPAPNDDLPLTTVATAGAVAGAAKPHSNRQDQALDGWETANDPARSAGDNPIANARKNADIALQRTDLPPDIQQRVTTVVERLGVSLESGKVEPNINSHLRADLHTLATGMPNDNGAFNGALAQLNRAAEVLDRHELAPGTKLAYDPEAGQSGLNRANLPALEVAKIDADIYFKTDDGMVHLESVKDKPSTIAGTVKDSVNADKTGSPSQIGRQTEWANAAPTEQPRQVTLATQYSGDGVNQLLNSKNMEQLGKLASANPDARQFVLGERAFSFNELTQISRAANVAAEAHVSSLPQGEFEIGTPAHKNFLRAAYGEFYANTAANSVDVVNNFAPELGEKLTPLTRLPGSAVAEAKQGGLWGGVSSGVMTAIHVTRDGFDIADLAPIAKNSAIGGAAGAVTALGERALQPVVEKAVGQSIGGVAVRQAVTRAGAATPIGTVAATAMSAYENREGLAQGDSQAIGRVTADTGVAAVSIAGGTALGTIAGSVVTSAAAGSVVPGAGTVVGAVVGIGVGVGIAYGAQISGATDYVADQAASAVDWVKSWF